MIRGGPVYSCEAAREYNSGDESNESCKNPLEKLMAPWTFDNGAGEQVMTTALSAHAQWDEPSLQC
jgi:hypothetical protein